MSDTVNNPLYIMRKVSLERYYLVLYDCALTSTMSKMALKSFCDKTHHILYLVSCCFYYLLLFIIIVVFVFVCVLLILIDYPDLSLICCTLYYNR